MLPSFLTSRFFLLQTSLYNNTIFFIFFQLFYNYFFKSNISYSDGDILNALFLFGFFLVSGIYLFFIGLKTLETNLSLLLTKSSFKKFNSYHPFILVIIGTFLSAIIQSTSASLALTIPFISTGLISPLNAIYLLLGFNIGTSSTLIINNFDKLLFSSIFFFLFVFFYIIRNIHTDKNKLKYISFLFLGISLIFFSLNMINKSIVFLIRIPFYLSFINHLTFNYMYPFLIGTLSSLLIQSSSVVLSTFQQLYISSNIDLAYFVLLSLGGNIGSTITGVIASYKFDKKSKLVSYFNIFYNIIGSLFFLIILKYLIILIYTTRIFFNLSKGYDITICHFIINLGTSLLFYPFIKPLYRLFNYYFD